MKENVDKPEPSKGSDLLMGMFASGVTSGHAVEGYLSEHSEGGKGNPRVRMGGEAPRVTRGNLGAREKTDKAMTCLLTHRWTDR